jgi:DNA-binding CsgD family transcriptional regulator
MGRVLFHYFGEYALALVIVGGVLAWANRIKTRCVTIPWFDDYFNYLLYFYLAAIGSQLIPHLGFHVIPTSGYLGEIYYFLFQTFLGLPLSLLFLFYFLRFAAGLSGRSVSPAVWPGYLAGSVAIFLACTFLSMWAFQSKRLSSLAIFQAVISGLFVLILALVPLGVILRARAVKDPAFSRNLAWFAAVQIAGLAGGQLILALLLTEDEQFGHHLIRLLVNIPPLAVLARFADREMASMKEAPESRINMEKALARLEITPREGEIIRLVLLGKTNAEIAAELFISLKTVKHHIYNVYQKLRVKNRVQLVNFVLAFDRPDPGPDRKS